MNLRRQRIKINIEMSLSEAASTHMYILYVCPKDT